MCLSSLTNHEKSDCGRSPIYQCFDCKKYLSSFYTLKAHQEIHAGIKNFTCEFCGKQIRMKSEYLRHRRTHTGEKPFKCGLCEKSFVDCTSRKIHQSVHTGIKPYMCQGCGDRFSCVSNLQSHRRARTDTCGSLPLIAKAFPPQPESRKNMVPRQPKTKTFF